MRKFMKKKTKVLRLQTFQNVKKIGIFYVDNIFLDNQIIKSIRIKNRSTQFMVMQNTDGFQLALICSYADARLLRFLKTFPCFNKGESSRMFIK